MTRAQAAEVFVSEAVKDRAAELRAASKRMLAEALRLENADSANQRFRCLPFEDIDSEVMQAAPGCTLHSCETAATFIAKATGVPVSFAHNDRIFVADLTGHVRLVGEDKS